MKTFLKKYTIFETNGGFFGLAGTAKGLNILYLFSPYILNDIGNLKDKIVDFAQYKLRKEEAEDFNLNFLSRKGAENHEDNKIT